MYHVSPDLKFDRISGGICSENRKSTSQILDFGNLDSFVSQLEQSSVNFSTSLSSLLGVLNSFFSKREVDYQPASLSQWALRADESGIWGWLQRSRDSRQFDWDLYLQKLGWKGINFYTRCSLTPRIQTDSIRYLIYYIEAESCSGSRSGLRIFLSCLVQKFCWEK